MSKSHQPRIGLLVPSSNTTMEPEFYAMAPEGVTIHTARMNLTEVTPEGLFQMAEDVGRASKLLASADVNVIVYGCTTGSLVGGVEWEENLVEGITRKTGIPALSTSGAVTQALEAVGGRKIGVATPYSEELNSLEKVFLEGHGFEVTSIRGLGLVDNLDIGVVEGETVEDLARRVSGGSDAVFISCTNLPTIDLIERLEDALGKPVVTSNQASMWAALRELGLGGVDGFGELMRIP